MLRARMIGNYIQNTMQKKEISITDLGKILNYSDDQVMSLIKGRVFASFLQLSNIATFLDVSVADILNGNSEEYNKTVVHCMNQFQNSENREKILDLIDDYMDILDAVRDN